MRVSNDYFEGFNDATPRTPRRLQRMIDEQRRRVRRMKAKSGFGPGDEWDEDWTDDDYDDEYSDYDENEFDSYGVTR